MLYLRLFLANLKIIYRNRQALFWALAFPLIFVTIFALFRLDAPSALKMAVIDQAQDDLSVRLVQNLGELKLLKLNATLTEEEARRQLAEDALDAVLLIPSGLAARAGRGESVTLTLLYDQVQLQTSQVVQGVVARFLDQANLAIQGAQPLLELESLPIQARQLSYFDFLLPGFVGMGVMTFAVIGVASQLALYRQQRILKRIKATPLPVRAFFIAQISAWLMLSLAQTTIILAAGKLLFQAHIYGNVLWAFPLVVLGNVAFLNLGFIVGSLARTVDAANGLANAVSTPMMFFSGVFFPTDSLPWGPPGDRALSAADALAERPAGRAAGSQGPLGLPVGAGSPGPLGAGHLGAGSAAVPVRVAFG